MGGGQVENEQYKVTVPFEMRMGLIIVKVKIQGNDYDFMFDSGAPNVVSLELGEKLKLKSAGKTYTRGSQGERHRVDYANIENIQIGGLNYTHTSAAIMDLKKAVVLDCMELDGILGANVMRNSVWQINYQKKEFIITNSTDSLEFSAKLDTVPFTTKHTGTPVIDVSIGNITQKRVTLDTGSGGHIDLDYSTYKNNKKNNPNMKTTSGFGSSSSGIYGIGKPDTLVYFKVDTVSIGTVILNDQICYASKSKTSSTLGTRFLENYIVTLDWGRDQMVLDSVSEYSYSELKHIGFKPKFTDNALRVGFVYSESVCAEQMSIDDQILKIDSTDYTKITQQDFCTLILDTNKKDYENRTVHFVKNGQTHSITLSDSVLLK